MSGKKGKTIVGVLVIIIGLPVTLILTALACCSIMDKTNGSMVSSGVTRRYLLYVPKTYDRSRPAPLVISIHPGATWPAVQRSISLWNDLADQYGFLVDSAPVHKSGRWGQSAWGAMYDSLPI